MADQKVNINIGSSYNGSGMQRALGAVDSLSKTAGKAAGAVGRLGSAFGGIGGEAGKAVGAVTSLIGTLATGGLIGGAIAAVTSLVGMFKQMADEAEAAEKAQMKAFSDDLNRQVDKYGKELDKVIGKLDKVSKAQQQVAKNQIAIGDAATNQGVAQIQLGAINEASGKDAAERAVIQAKANVETSKLKGDNSIKTADINASAAQTKLDNTNSAIQKTQEEIRSLAQHIEVRKDMTSRYQETAQKSGYQDRKAVDKAHASYMALQKANKKMTELQEKLASLQEQQANDSSALEVAQQNAKTARLNAELDYAKATQALKDAEEKQWDEEEKARHEEAEAAFKAAAESAERKQKMAEEKKAEEDLKKELKREEGLRKQLDQATEELKQAEKNLARKLENVKIENLGWRGGGGGWGGGPGGWGREGGNNGGGNAGGNNNQQPPEAPIPEGQVIGNGINGANRYGARNNASIHDAAYNARVQAGYERNARSQGYGNSAKEQHAFDEQNAKLKRAGLDPNTASAEDREKVLGKSGNKEWEKRASKDPQRLKDKAQKEAEKAAQEKEAKQAAKEQAEKDLQTNVKNIYDLMKKLGLE